MPAHSPLVTDKERKIEVLVGAFGHDRGEGGGYGLIVARQSKQRQQGATEAGEKREC